MTATLMRPEPISRPIVVFLRPKRPMVVTGVSGGACGRMCDLELPAHLLVSVAEPERHASISDWNRVAVVTGRPALIFRAIFRTTHHARDFGFGIGLFVPEDTPTITRQHQAMTLIADCGLPIAHKTNPRSAIRNHVSLRNHCGSKTSYHDRSTIG